MASTGVVIELPYEGISLNTMMLHVNMKKVYDVAIVIFGQDCCYRYCSFTQGVSYVRILYSLHKAWCLC